MNFGELKQLAMKPNMKMVQLRRIDGGRLTLMQYPDNDPVFNNAPTRRVDVMTRDDLKKVCTFFAVEFRS